jgi:hypothetical protein
MIARALGLACLAPLWIGCSEAPPDASSEEAQLTTPWCHAWLGATDGTSVSIDYRAIGSFTHGNRFFGLDPVWFNVHRQDLGEHDAVRLVFVDLDQQTTLTSQTIDLTFAEPGRFTGQARAFESAVYRHQQVAVVINGTWLKDPIGGGSNFSVDLAGDSGRTVLQCGVTF